MILTNQQFIPFFVLVFLFVSSTETSAGEAESLIAMVKRFSHIGMTKGDIHSLDSLFSEDFMMVEQGGKDASWAAYRDHHLGPELAAMISFEIDHEVIEPHFNGRFAWVLQTMNYHIEFKNGKTVHSKATVTYVLEKQVDGWKFNHIHWSFRPLKTDGH